MKTKTKRSAFLLGLGMSMAMLSGVSNANSPYEECLIDCIQRYQICINAGIDGALCSRNKQLCRWGCGTPQ